MHKLKEKNIYIYLASAVNSETISPRIPAHWHNNFAHHPVQSNLKQIVWRSTKCIMV